MLREQTIPQTRYPRSLLGTDCLNRQVAFGVQSHGSVCEVRRPDAKQSIVYDQNLGVHADTLAVKTGDDRIADPQAVETIGSAQSANRLRSQRFDGVFFEPAGVLERKHDDDFRAAFSLEATA